MSTIEKWRMKETYASYYMIRHPDANLAQLKKEPGQRFRRNVGTLD
jgi:hypothetical protein